MINKGVDWAKIVIDTFDLSELTPEDLVSKWENKMYHLCQSGFLKKILTCLSSYPNSSYKTQMCFNQ